VNKLDSERVHRGAKHEQLLRISGPGLKSIKSVHERAALRYFFERNSASPMKREFKKSADALWKGIQSSALNLKRVHSKEACFRRMQLYEYPSRQLKKAKSNG